MQSEEQEKETSHKICPSKQMDLAKFLLLVMEDQGLELAEFAEHLGVKESRLDGIMYRAVNLHNHEYREYLLKIPLEYLIQYQNDVWLPSESCEWINAFIEFTQKTGEAKIRTLQHDAVKQALCLENAELKASVAKIEGEFLVTKNELLKAQFANKQTETSQVQELKTLLAHYREKSQKLEEELILKRGLK